MHSLMLCLRLEGAVLFSLFSVITVYPPIKTAHRCDNGSLTLCNFRDTEIVLVRHKLKFCAISTLNLFLMLMYVIGEHNKPSDSPVL